MRIGIARDSNRDRDSNTDSNTDRVADMMCLGELCCNAPMLETHVRVCVRVSVEADW